MFRRVSLPRVFYFSLRFAFLLSYLQWLVSEVAEAQPKENHDRLLHSMSLQSNWAATLYDFVVVDADYTLTEIQKKIHDLLVFDLTLQPTPYQQTMNTDFLADILFNMYQSNPLDHCKLEFLIKHNPGFYILASDKKTKEATHANAAYSPVFNILHLYDFNIQRQPEAYTQTFSHLLRHAVDTFNNFKNGFCLHLGYPRSFIHGDTTAESCRLDSPDAWRVYRLVNDDLKAVVRLFENNNLPATLRTQAQWHQLFQLGTLLTKYNYVPGTFTVAYDKVAAELFLKTYTFNAATHTYRLNSNQVAVTYPMQVDLFDGKTYELPRFLLEYNSQLREATWGFSQPFDRSAENLVSDLLNNIIMRLYTLKLHYTDSALSYKAGAHLDEVLSPYSRPVVHEGKVTNLRNWLFPRLSAHEKTRYSKEFKDCLEGQEEAAISHIRYPTAF